MAPPVPAPTDVEAEDGDQSNIYKWKRLSIDEQQKAIESLIDESEDLVQSAGIELEDARELVRKAGLSIESSAIASAAQEAPAIPVATTGGYSNTDHVVLQTGDHVTDRIEELKRNLWLRTQQSQRDPELTLQKWDKPREAGGRRRRVAREHPDAPFEPPPSGYIIFLGQMTTKIRHDRPNSRHNQAEIMPEISKMWRKSMSEVEQKYYNDLADKIRDEFKKQHMEFRATGSFTPSDNFLRKGHFWTHKILNERNALEHELDSYETVYFPPRPPEYDEAYFERERDSKRRRKLRDKGIDPDQHVDNQDEDWTPETDPKLSEAPEDEEEDEAREKGLDPDHDVDIHDENWTGMDIDPKADDDEEDEVREKVVDPDQDVDNHDDLKSREAPEDEKENETREKCQDGDDHGEDWTAV